MKQSLLSLYAAIIILQGLFFAFSMLFPVSAIAQNTSQQIKPINFSGSSNLTVKYSNRQAFGQEIPPQYLNWHARARLSIYGLPIELGSLLSTQNSQTRQPMNYFSVKLDSRSIMRHPEIAGKVPFMKYFETLEIGRTRPEYSDLMLRGVPINGLNISFRAKGLHAAVAYGNTQKPVSEGLFLYQRYQQKLIFGRIGFGQKNGTNFNISVLHAKDIAESIEPTPLTYIRQPDTFVYQLDTFFIRQDSVALVRKPIESLMAGTGINIALFKNRFRINAELAGSVFTANSNSENIYIEAIPGWLERIYKPTLSTSASYAYSIGSELNIQSTRLTVSMRRIAPGYQAPGTDYMRQDIMVYEARLNQVLFNRKLTLQPYFQWYRDNISGMKAYTTSMLRWGVITMWRPTHLPYLSLAYMPNLQKMQHSTSPESNHASVLTASSGKNYRIGKLNAFTSVSWSNQIMKSKTPESWKQFHANNFSFQQSVQLKVPVTIITNLGFYILDNSEEKTKLFQIQLMANYQHEKKWNAGLGIRHFNQDPGRKRTGLTARFSYELGKYGQIIFAAEPIKYRDRFNPSREFDEYSARISLINKW
jgi:hypothetical protein